MFAEASDVWEESVTGGLPYRIRTAGPGARMRPAAECFAAILIFQGTTNVGAGLAQFLRQRAGRAGEVLQAKI